MRNDPYCFGLFWQLSIVDTYRVIEPREANGIPMTKVASPPIMQPQVAIEGVFAAMQRAWKSKADKFPNARMKIVAQFQKIALGLQEEKTQCQQTRETSSS